MLYKRMPFIKRQVKHLTKEALDPTRCFSIVLDQVRTISFRLGETKKFWEYSHPQSTSLKNFLADKAEEPYIRP